MNVNEFELSPEEVLVEQLEDLQDSKLVQERSDGPFVEVVLSDLN